MVKIILDSLMCLSKLVLSLKANKELKLGLAIGDDELYSK